ncbi:hypothetical protein ILYODFUR_032012 [Ilyodon furcidens]|uniref:Uncharacterized protein n=1 Tax=Ilyodon furcidens TaxID=33524 RepID=A0ABV0UYB2_9TELE
MKLSHPGSASAENTPLFLRLASPAFRQLHPPVKTYPPSNEPNYPAALTATLDSITPLKAWIISYHSKLSYLYNFYHCACCSRLFTTLSSFLSGVSSPKPAMSPSDTNPERS